MKFFTNLILIIAMNCLLLTACYYGMGKEIERREAETAYHIQRCEADPEYYPDFCKHLLGE